MPSIDKIAVARGEHQRQLSAIGPSLSGWVYGDAPSGLFARAVPVAELRLAARRAYEQHVAVNRAACGTVFQARQDVEAHGLFVVGYEVEPGTRALEDILRGGSLQDRLAAVAAVCDAIPTWWSVVGAPLLPLAADIVITAAGAARLLPRFPSREIPAAALFEVSHRVNCLAPDYFRSRPEGADAAASQCLDLFALGALLRRVVLADHPSEASDRALVRAVHGRLHHDGVPDPALPLWIHRLPAVTQIRDLSQRWTAPAPEARRELEPATVASALRTLAGNTTPVDAVRAVYRAERSEAVAYGFVRDLLSKEESPELLMEAAWRAAALSRLSQALDHYERAIEIAPDFLPAYVEQLQLICSASASPDPELAGLFEIDLEFAARMEQRLARDFERIERTEHLEAAEYEVQVADYYLRRTRALPARLNDVARFVHARMHGRDGQLDPRKVELNVVYAELLLHERPADAATQLLRVDSLLNNHRLHRHVLPRRSLDRARARAAWVRRALARQGSR